jgi:single-stranded DNA-binding protein
MVAVDGRLTKRSYVNKEGKTTYITEIMVDTINSLVKNKSNDDSGILKKYDKHITEKIENEEQEEDFANIIHNVNGGNN